MKYSLYVIPEYTMSLFNKLKEITKRIANSETGKSVSEKISDTTTNVYNYVKQVSEKTDVKTQLSKTAENAYNYTKQLCEKTPNIKSQVYNTASNANNYTKQSIEKLPNVTKQITTLSSNTVKNTTNFMKAVKFSVLIFCIGILLFGFGYAMNPIVKIYEINSINKGNKEITKE